MIAAVVPETTFDPRIEVIDAATRRWLREATLRLRREVAWRWHEQELHPRDAAVSLDPDRVIDALDLRRHWPAKRAFFATDVAARYLSERLADIPEDAAGVDGWAIDRLVLEPVAALALGVGLLARSDAAAGTIIGACLGDTRRTDPSLALVQRLADDPEDALALVSMSHPLWALGLLVPADEARGSIGWDAPYSVPPLVAARLLQAGAWWPAGAKQLAGGDRAAVPLGGMRPLAPASLPPEPGPLPDRLRTPAEGLRVVPVNGARGADVHGAVGAVAGAAGRRVAAIPAGSMILERRADLGSLLTVAWLDDTVLLLEDERSTPGQPSPLAEALVACSAVPVTVFLRAGRDVHAQVPDRLRLPALVVPPLTFGERLARWMDALGDRANELGDALPECARRFRFEAGQIDAVAAGLVRHPGPLTADILLAACRAVSTIDLGGLAQPVQPRFRRDEIVLPPAQQRQFAEIEAAMRSLAEVHYRWGTARAWNEAGVSVLFAGASGTGKTMAAEVLAAELAIPMFRVNLAQVVDKYIGETEKNLERIFDAADTSDCVLFFDEADAMFGKRTDVRDAHDRYANVEVAFLLERMERFKGLAILATNRRGDLDEAFLRRLRYIVEFPVPDAAERRSIWERAIPEGVDAVDLDIDFLARQFQLTGGTIRSAVFNACLQAAAAQRDARGTGWTATSTDRAVLRMDHVLVAVKREHDKLERTTGPGQFGPYAAVLAELGDG